MASEADEKVLNGILGRALLEWKLSEDAMHFTLDDGSVLIFTGQFQVAVYRPDVIH